MSYKAFYTLSLKISTIGIPTQVGQSGETRRQGDGEQFLTQMIAEYTACFEAALVNGLGENDRLVELKNI